MKRIILFLVVCLITTTAFAEIFNIQTSGIVKVMNGNKITCKGDYSFSVDTDSKVLYITRNDYGESCFSGTGTYSISTVKKVQDNYMGTAYSFLLLKNGINYVVTITNQLISFSQSGHTNSESWNFWIK